MYQVLNLLKQLITDNRYIKENGYEIFETEWKNYKQPINRIVEDLVSRPFLLFPYNIDDNSIQGIIY